MQRKSARLWVVSLIFFVLLCPAVLVLSVFYLPSRYYYLSAVAVILLSLVPFWVMFEHRRIKTGEIVIIAMLISLAVAGRAVMTFIPQIKPTAALVIIAGVAFGANVGFAVGSVTMFISNFIFGQGMFTPFQMLGLGLVGFLCGAVFCGRRAANNRLAVALTGAAAVFLIYGPIVDSCSVLTMLTDFNASSVFSVYVTGAPFNLLYAASTAAFLFLLGKPMNEKLERLRIKYGIFEL